MNKTLNLIIIISLLGAGAYLGICKYLEIGSFAPDYIVNTKEAPPLLIAHAGGVLRTGRTEWKDIKDPITYTRSTNAKEAFYQSYNQGIRYFEGDLVFTTDNQIILRHSWGSYLYGLSGQTPPDSGPNEARSLKDITDRLMFGTKHVMTGQDIIEFLEKYEDARFVLDIKALDDLGNMRYLEILQTLKKLANNQSSILDRIIPQAYSLEDVQMIQTFYSFPDIWFTLYKYNGSESELIDLMKNKQITGLICGNDVYSKKETLLTKVKQYNIPIYINTINDIKTLNSYIDQGISGVYTDVIRQTTDGYITIGNDYLTENY